MDSNSYCSKPSGCIAWFTGLSGAGKSTLAEAVQQRIAELGRPVQILDGDVVRPHLCKDLGFSHADRIENVRRIAFVANLLANNQVVVLVPVIAPYRAVREELRQNYSTYLEVFVNAPLETCEERDPKGLYRRARAGQIKNFTGISDPYETPESPDVECRTDTESLEVCVDKIVTAIELRISNPTVSNPTGMNV